MPRESRTIQHMVGGRDQMHEASWKFGAGVTSAPEADERRARMRAEEEQKLEGRKEFEQKKYPLSPKKEGRGMEKTPKKKILRGRADQFGEEPDKVFLGKEERKMKHRGENDSRFRQGAEKQYKGSQIWNLRHKEARAARMVGERAPSIVAQGKELSQRSPWDSTPSEFTSPTFEAEKPNPENLAEREKMTFADLLQAGWLKLDDQAYSRLLDRFDQEESMYLEGRGHDVGLVRMQLEERLPVALDCLNDRTNPEFGPAIAQLIKLVESFFERNADEFAKFDRFFEEESSLQSALRDFVEAMIFRIAYFAELDHQADAWEKKQALRNAIDKLGDVEIPKYFQNLYSRSIRLTAQVDLLSHQIRELAYTLYDHPKNEKQEARKARSLEQKVLREGIRQLTIEDLFPLFANGVDISKVPGHEQDIKQVAIRLANWQHPDFSSSMFRGGKMTSENAEKFNLLVKEILHKILEFYRHFSKTMSKVDNRFISPEEKLKNILQYIFHYHYRIYAPGSYDSNSSSIISHFEDAINKVAEAMFTTPLGDIERQLSNLRSQLATANKIEKLSLQKEIEELVQFKKQAHDLQDYLYRITSRAYPFTKRVEEVA